MWLEQLLEDLDYQKPCENLGQEGEPLIDTPKLEELKIASAPLSLCCGLTKPQVAACSLPDQWDWGEDQKNKSQKNHGLA